MCTIDSLLPWKYFLIKGSVMVVLLKILSTEYYSVTIKLRDSFGFLFYISAVTVLLWVIVSRDHCNMPSNSPPEKGSREQGNYGE